MQRSALVTKVVCVFDHCFGHKTPAATAALKEWAAEDAATVAASPREVASQVDALVSVLPNDKVLRSVVFDGDDGLLAGFNAGALHVSVSTVSPHSSRELAEAHEAQASE